MLPLNAIEREMSAICEDCMRENGKEEQRQAEKQGPAKVKIYTLVVEDIKARGLGTQVGIIYHSLN